jgi:hypothetical protein
MDAHLLVDKVRCSEQDVELTGHEESMSLCSISVEVTGDAQFDFGGLQHLQSGGYKVW